MKILSLDSTALVCSVAVSDGDKLISEITINTGNTHSETLLPAVENALRLSNTYIDDIDVFACSVGPGSFTGVRIGTATVKGIAYGKNKPCVAVSTLDALAENLSSFEGILCPVMNARRGQVYNALYRCESGVITRLCPDRAISVDELDRELSRYSEPIYLCGDGYDITLKGSKQTKFADVPMRLRLQSAYSVCVCALRKYERGEYVTDKELAPTYLRPSQAERERMERLEKENKL